MMADDLFDEFLAEVSSIQTPPTTSAPASNFSLDDDEDDDLDNVFSSAGGQHTQEKIQHQVESSMPNEDDNDFLSWLNESPTPTPSKKIDSHHVNDKPQLAVETKSSVHVDDFFSEVFGDEATPDGSPTSKGDQNFAFEADIFDILESSFPDVVELRNVLINAGYIPAACRGQIWSLLLTGSNTEDHEALHFRASGVEVPNSAELAADCDAMVNSSKWHNDFSRDLENDRQDLHDIIALYCVRRQVEYNSLFCHLAAPMLAATAPISRGLASSCFYSIASEFIPLISYKQPARDTAAEVLHSWLRLLINYHSPRLVQHLDRVLPGWERPTAGISAAQVEELHLSQKASDGLDQLERELGMDLDDDLFAPSAWNDGVEFEGVGASGARGPVESARPKALHGGCVPLEWTCGAFTGAVPPQHACTILDWAIVTEERYTGLYLSAALLEVFSKSLLMMTGPQVREWFQKVTTGAADWYKDISVIEQPRGQEHDLQPTVVHITSWSSFINGWIHAAAALRRTSPDAFRQALASTDDWAEARATVFASSDEQLGRAAMAVVQGDKEAQGDHKGFLMERFRRLSVIKQQFKLDRTLFRGSDDVNDSDTEGATSGVQRRWPHDDKADVDTMCLWTSPEEVVPCMSSNRRPPVCINTITMHFQEGLSVSMACSSQWEGEGAKVQYGPSSSPSLSGIGRGRGRDGVCLPQHDDNFPNAKPFYFGIDCRWDNERVIGKFPKAYAVDPSFITDTEAVAALLEILEPIASSVHLCIIGAGEEFARHSSKGKVGDAGDGKKVVLRAVEDQAARLNAIAVFFTKRSFKYVSILEGGFVAAARHLHSSKSYVSLTSSLVDVDIAALEAVLGIASSSTSVGAAVAVGSSLASSVGSTSLPFMGTAGSNPSLAAVGSFFSNVLKKDATSAAGGGGGTGTVGEKAGDSNTVTSVAAVGENAKQLLSGLGKRVSLFGASSLDSIKKSGWVPVVGASASAESKDATAVASSTGIEAGVGRVSKGGGDKEANTFVIDDDDEEPDDDGMGPRSKEGEIDVDPNKINISRTDQERALALAQHVLGGLRKGDKVIISREHLPGAVLFPAVKFKEAKEETAQVGTLSGQASTEGEVTGPQGDGDDGVDGADQVMVHRFLVVTRERFIVLDSGGGGIGSEAVVKSNHHLTELLKMTFRKRDPELVTLFFLSPGSAGTKTRQYRVSKRVEFVEGKNRRPGLGSF